jgi:hypothetical protein
MSNFLYPGLGIKPIKHRVFVSYHHRGDQAYYDAFSRLYHDTYEVIYDNSLERKIDSDNVDYVMQQIREKFIIGTSCTVVLVGAQTWGRKYVDWEIKGTLDKQHGLIGVWLPTIARNLRNEMIVPDRLLDNIQSGFAVWLSWAELMSGTTALDGYIRVAKSKRGSLINNRRDRRLRNS